MVLSYTVEEKYGFLEMRSRYSTLELTGDQVNCKGAFGSPRKIGSMFAGEIKVGGAICFSFAIRGDSLLNETCSYSASFTVSVPRCTEPSPRFTKIWCSSARGSL